MLLLALILPLVVCYDDLSPFLKRETPTTVDDVKSAEISEYARHVRSAMVFGLEGAQLVKLEDLRRKRSVDSRHSRSAMVMGAGGATVVPFDQLHKPEKRAADTRDKRMAMVADDGMAPKLVSLADLDKEGNDAALTPVHFNELKKRSVDKLKDADMSASLGDKINKRSPSSGSDEKSSSSSESGSTEDSAEQIPSLLLATEEQSDNSTVVEGSGEVELTRKERSAYTFGLKKAVREEKKEEPEELDATERELMDEFEGPSSIEGSGEVTSEDAVPEKKPRWSFSSHVNNVEGSGETTEEKVRDARWAPFSDWFGSNEATTETAPALPIDSVIETNTELPLPVTSHFLTYPPTTESPMESTTAVPFDSIPASPIESTAENEPEIVSEGSNDHFEILRHVRQAEASTASVLGVEQPVVQSARRHDSDSDSDRDRRPTTTTTARPDRPTLTCETVDCMRGTSCVMENGRPSCKLIRGGEQPTCRNVNCPRGTRCSMEKADSRCRGRDCSEQPVCLRESSRASCNSVQCPSGTRCSLIEEPGCRFNCREIATCLNPCDGVRCPFGSSCRFDGRDAVCASIALDACLSARCPGGFECRTQQNQARCFPVNTPAPTLPPTTTPTPVSCLGQNEEFATCATFCEPTCVEKNPPCISACAAPRCQCANGFYRNQQGVCVFSEQCEFIPSCSVNEIFTQCSTPCEPRCGQPLQLACPAICGPSKCQCKPGFWRHQTGSCVQQNQCFNG